MMFRQNLVACVKVAGKILRETDNVVTIPFGSEYSLLIKNLNTVRIQIKVSVDGVDATEGTWLVIAANSSVELERFIRNSNWNSGNRFKFIERTEQIEAHRGIGSDDGLIRIEWKRELNVPQAVHVPVIHDHYHHDYDDYPWWPRSVPPPRPWRPWPRPPWGPTIYRSGPSAGSGRPTRSMGRPAARAAGASQQRQEQTRSRNMNYARASVSEGTASLDCAFNDAGITVPGSQSNQQFVSAQWFATETQSEVLILKLRGKVGNVAVQEPVTVNHKPQCGTCGRVNKGGSQFCSQCGTALQLV